MNKVLNNFIIWVMFFTVAFSLATEGMGGKSYRQAENVKKVILDIKGMHCAACPTIIREGLERVDGVLDVKVSGANNTARISYDADKLNVDSLTRVIGKIGYQATVGKGIRMPSMVKKVTLSIPGMHCVACPTIVRKSLENLEGVIEVKVSGASKTASVIYDKNKIDADMLMQSTAKVGYPAMISKSVGPSMIKKVTLSIPGMHCVACPTIVRKSLENLKGVIEVKVSGATKTASVIYDENRISINALIKATAVIGYPSMVNMETNNASALIKRVTLTVPGMHCVSCPTIVRKSLERLNGVLEVKVSGVNKTASVMYNAEVVSVNDMMKATGDIGYPSKLPNL